MENEKVFNMKFAKIYTLLVQKAEKKGRTKEEVNQILNWMVGVDEDKLEIYLKEDVSIREFFERVPSYNPNCDLIKGVVCNVRVEEIQDPLMKKIRQLDKLIDELAKGRSMDKILRKGINQK